MNYQFENDEDTIREKRKGQCPGDAWIKLWISIVTADVVGACGIHARVFMNG